MRYKDKCLILEIISIKCDLDLNVVTKYFENNPDIDIIQLLNDFYTGVTSIDSMKETIIADSYLPIS
jgi:hypothetical protein